MAVFDAKSRYAKLAPVVVNDRRGQVLALPIPDAPAPQRIIGRHPRLRAAIRLLRKVASTESTVLLLGESGTGKELFAQSLHALSERRAGPFVALNCAAIPSGVTSSLIVCFTPVACMKRCFWGPKPCDRRSLH